MNYEDMGTVGLCDWVNSAPSLALYESRLWRASSLIANRYSGGAALTFERLCPREPFERRELAAVNSQYKNMKALAMAWATVIQTAFLRREPCPIIAEPRFEWVLSWAFELAHVPRECVTPCPSISPMVNQKQKSPGEQRRGS